MVYAKLLGNHLINKTQFLFGNMIFQTPSPTCSDYLAKIEIDYWI